MSQAITNDVLVEVESHYVPERSDPNRPMFFFAYQVKITNRGKQPVQLLSRYWHITDANGNVEEVRGSGVVGHKPRLEQGQSFEYTSFCPLPTGFGVMHGAFQMAYDNEERFEVAVAPFKLAMPFSVN